MMTSPAETYVRGTVASLPSMEEVFDRYAQRIYGFFYGHVGNREDAEDLTSETFLKASRELDVSRSEASVRSWLFTVARTILADHWRRYYRFGYLHPIDDYFEDPGPEEVRADASVLATERQVADILAALPERYGRVLQLRFLTGLTVRETAQEMGVTPENVKVLQHRALARAVALTNGTAKRVVRVHREEALCPTC